MFQFDHAVVIVSSLRRAVREFESLGFQVVLGGRTGPVHNALLIFQDGTYVELTTTRPAVTPIFRALHRVGATRRIAHGRNDMLSRFFPWLGAAVGPIDWCIRVDDVASTVGRLRNAGIEMIDAQPFERTRPDGEVARWLLAGPRDTRLPFFIEDQTPVEIRVPNVEGSSHSNGAAGIRTLEVPSAISNDLETMLEALAPEAEAKASLGNVNLSPSDSANPFALEVFGTGEPKALDTSKTSGARIRLVQ